MLKWLIALLAGVLLLVSSEAAFATPLTCPTPVVPIAGQLNPTQDAKQNGRLNRGTPVSTCAAPTSAPAVVNPGSLYTFDRYGFRNRTGAPACISVTLTSSDDVSAAAYSLFDPSDIRKNYLGDTGNRASPGNPKTFSFKVANLGDFTIVVSEGVDGAGGNYTLSVSGCGEITVTNVVPSYGPVAGGTDVTIKGGGFVSGAAVTFAGIPATNVVVVDDFTIQARTPPHAAGPVDVNVTNTNGTSATRAKAFTYWNPVTSSIVLTSSANPSLFGQLVTFTASVTPKIPGPATGSITFFDNGVPIGTTPLDSTGAAKLAIATLSVGSHAIGAAYLGDAIFTSATNKITQIVNPAATLTTLQSSSNPSIVTQPLTFTATVSPIAPGAGVPTGDVTFKEGATVLGTATLNGTGVATLTLSTLPVGSHDIVASYPGDTSFQPSRSTTLSQAINLSGTALTLNSSFNPSTVGASVTFTASVASTVGGVPTGQITFSDGNVALGAPVDLDANGVATFTIGALAVGNHAIKASYPGDTNNQPATGELTQIVNPAPTTTTLASSENPSLAGDSVTFTATISSALSGTFGGSVTFKDGDNIIGTVAVGSDKTATFTTSALFTGTHPITAVYGGDTIYAPSASDVLQQVVNAEPPDGGPDAGFDAGPDAGSDAAPGVDAGAPDSGSVRFDDEPQEPQREVEGGGCGCQSTSSLSDVAGGAATFLAALLLVTQRRRRRN